MDGLLYNVAPVKAESETAANQPAFANTPFDPSGPVMERIYLGAMGPGIRVLAVASCAASGSRRSLARALAARCALSGERTLLLDVTTPVSTAPVGGAWMPGSGLAATSVELHPTGYDFLEAAGCSVSSMRLRNIEGLRRLLREELAVYRVIIVDAGEIMGSPNAVVPPATALQVCDSVILSTAADRVGKHEFEQAMATVGNARSRIAGLVLDDLGSPTVGEQMCSLVGRMRTRLPRVASFLERKLTGTKLLWATL